jgi:hypothetical protein
VRFLVTLIDSKGAPATLSLNTVNGTTRGSWRVLEGDGLLEFTSGYFQTERAGFLHLLGKDKRGQWCTTVQLLRFWEVKGLRPNAGGDAGILRGYLLNNDADARWEI